MAKASILLITLVVVYLPLTGSLLYVWWKYGGPSSGVKRARIIYLGGSLVLITAFLFL